MRRYTISIPAVLIALVGSLAVPAGENRGAGHLVMIGGSLNSDNERIYQKMIDLAGEDALVGIVPAAASDWERSTQSAMDRFESYGVGDRTEIIEVHRDDLEAARSPEIVKQLEEKRLLFFTGGQQHRILTAFRPRDRDDAIPAYEALWSVLGNGGVIAGSSAGAAMMSDPQIRGGNSAGALDVYLRDGEGRGVRTERGMGFFPYGLTDQHFSERGRFARLVVALDREGITRGFGINENRALHVDLAAGSITGLGGHQAAMMIDMSDATNDGTMIDNIRVSMIGDGDVINGTTGRITRRIDMTPVYHRISPDETTTRGKTGGIKGDPYFTSDDPWGDKVVAKAIGALTRSDSTVIVVGDEDFTVTLARDERTRMYIGHGQEDFALEELDFVVINARVTISVVEESNEVDEAGDEELIIIAPDGEESPPF